MNSLGFDLSLVRHAYLSISRTNLSNLALTEGTEILFVHLVEDPGKNAVKAEYMITAVNRSLLTYAVQAYDALVCLREVLSKSFCWL